MPCHTQELLCTDDRITVCFAQLGQADVVGALCQLPGTQCDTLILISASGLSYEAAALVADCKLGTVKSRIHCSRAAMGTIIADAETLPNC